MGEGRSSSGEPTHDAAAAPTTGASERSAPVASRTRLGRYLVVEEAGKGGMGRVLRAYDPKLRREVALKLLVAGTHTAEGAARIVREAQAMARLSHPNLVAVYDVEHDGEVVFIAMEYVEGDTLSSWLAAAPRSWREVVAAFVAAGRGLAAAHAAGIVHRDFKPSNAIVAADGRVRVMDFGLARGVAEANTGADAKVSAPELAELTQAGIVLGTLPYMAPEQHRGAPAAAASDQYAFCVALFHALYRVRPFEGDDDAALLAAKLRGASPFAPRPTHTVPGWLHAAVLRGLAALVEHRWPSMEALLAVLERGATRARRRRVLAAIGVLGAATAGVALVYALDVRERTTACERAGASIAEVWNDDVRARVRGALVASGTGYAETTADKVMPWLDEYAAAWQSARTEACLDADVRATWDEAMLERSLWCLDERRMDLAALVAELSRGDATAVPHAVAAAAGLARMDPCRRPAVLEQLGALPPRERRAEVLELHGQLARALALEVTGDYVGALELARAVRVGAESLDWPPLRASARLREAALLARRGAYDEAERGGEAAYYEAAIHGDWSVAAMAATSLVYVLGYRQGRLADALAWSRHAETALAHAVDPGSLLTAGLLGETASAYYIAGEYAQARAFYERALATFERELGPDHPAIASSLMNLGNVYFRTRDVAEARAFYERALAIQEAVLGPEHPDLAPTLNNLANLDQVAGDHAHACVLLERSLAISEKALGPDHPEIGSGLYNLARAHQSMGEYAEALPLFERSLAVGERARGPDHPDTAWSLAALASVHENLGHHARALELYERALAIFDRHAGEQPSESETRFEVAHLLATSDPRRARQLAEQARAGFQSNEIFGDELAQVEAWLAALPPAD